MKVFSTVVKVVVAIAAVAGVIYIAAAYGERIVAWCRRMLGRDFNFNPDFELEDDDLLFDEELDEETDFEG